MKTERPGTLNELKDFQFSVKQNKTTNCGHYAHASASTTIFHLWDGILKKWLEQRVDIDKGLGRWLEGCRLEPRSVWVINSTYYWHQTTCFSRWSISKFILDESLNYTMNDKSAYFQNYLKNIPN